MYGHPLYRLYEKDCKQRQLPDNLSNMNTKKTKATDAATTTNAPIANFVEQENREIKLPEIPIKEQTKRQAKKEAKKARKLAEKQTAKQQSKDQSCLLKQYQALCDEIPVATIGIDLGDLSHRICIYDRLGFIIEESAIDNNRLAITGLAHRYPDARFVMEVGSHRPWNSDMLRDLDCEVIVGNSSKLKAISEHERKSDELDARTLAKIGRMDVDLLYPVSHVSQEALRDRLIISTRENLVSHRKSLIQSVRGSVKPLSLRIDSV